MLKTDLYAIFTEKSERSGSIDEMFTSFEEAMNHRMEYANWWRPNGDVWIRKYEAGKKQFIPVEEWYIDKDGNVTNHYIWSHVV